MKILKTVGTGAILLSSLMFALTACSADQPTPQQGEELSFKSSSDPNKENEEGLPSFGGDSWTTAKGGDIKVVLHGSSSCPPEIEQVTRDTPTSVLITIAPSEGEACTMDYRAFWTNIADVGDVETVNILTENAEKPEELPKR